MGDDSYNPDNKIEIRALTAEEWEQDLNEEEQRAPENDKYWSQPFSVDDIEDFQI